MQGAIFYSTKYGSTADYARWIGEATGLPVFDADRDEGDPAAFDFLVLLTPVIYFKLRNRKWVARHRQAIGDKPVILATVSGAPAGEKLDGWIAGSLPADLVARMHHVALPGRQVREDLTLFDAIMLKIGGLLNRDREAGEQESKGFDFVDKASIEPVVSKIRSLESQGSG